MNYLQPHKYQKGDGVRGSPWSGPSKDLTGTQEAMYNAMPSSALLAVFVSKSYPYKNFSNILFMKSEHFILQFILNWFIKLTTT